jgi:hypothetical protein
MPTLKIDLSERLLGGGGTEEFGALLMDEDTLRDDPDSSGRAAQVGVLRFKTTNAKARKFGTKFS